MNRYRNRDFIGRSTNGGSSNFFKVARQKPESVCKWCRKRFKKRECLNRHVKNRVCRSKTCELCGFMTNSASQLINHQRKEHGRAKPKQVKRNVKDGSVKKTKTKLNREPRVDASDEGSTSVPFCNITNADLVCGVCKNAFSSKERRDTHIFQCHRNMTGSVIVKETHELIEKEANNAKRIVRQIHSNMKRHENDDSRSGTDCQAIDAPTFGISEVVSIPKEVFSEGYASGGENESDPKPRVKNPTTANVSDTRTHKQFGGKISVKLGNSKSSNVVTRSPRISGWGKRINTKPEDPEIIYKVYSDKTLNKSTIMKVIKENSGNVSTYRYVVNNLTGRGNVFRPVCVCVCVFAYYGQDFFLCP